LESFKKCFELKFEQTPGEEPIYKLGGGIFVDSWPIYRFAEVAELQSMLQVSIKLVHETLLSDSASVIGIEGILNLPFKC